MVPLSVPQNFRARFARTRITNILVLKLTTLLTLFFQLLKSIIRMIYIYVYV